MRYVTIICLALLLFLSDCNYKEVESKSVSQLYPKQYGEWVKAEMPPQTGFNRCWFYYVNEGSVEKSYPRILWLVIVTD